jgi:hypothetical protein
MLIELVDKRFCFSERLSRAGLVVSGKFDDGCA